MSTAGGPTETQVTEFGRMPDGTAVDLYTVWVGRTHASFTSYGARLVALTAADARGRLADVVQGYDSLAFYLADPMYQGAVVGRFANRIAGGKFSLDGVEYCVPANDKGNALHGGTVGFDQALWTGNAIEDGVEFTLVSADGDQGFPGRLTLRVRYTFAGGALRIEYEAETDAPTVLNVTNHAYFNLAGDSSGTAALLNHEIMIPAGEYTPVDAAMIPEGGPCTVAGTVFDLRRPVRIGSRVDEDDVQLKRAGGYDHNWAFGAAGEMKLACRLKDPGSGRVLTVETTEPGMQFYCGNAMDGSMPNRRGGRYERRSALCLETQHYPDSPNRPDFPATTLRPGETLRSTTVYWFSAE